MATADETIRRFIRYVALGETVPRSRVIVPDNRLLPYSLSERTIYSYGRHFPLCHYVPAKGKQPARFIVNGDLWRGGFSATHRHQDAVRREIAEAIKDSPRRIESILIPFSALDGAGIDFDSIRPINIRPDRSEKFDNTAILPASINRPLVSRAAMLEKGSNAARNEYSAIRESETLYRGIVNIRTVSRDSGTATASTRRIEITRATCYRGYDHSPGVSGFVDYDPPLVSLYVDGMPANVSEDGLTLTFETSRHWLGDSLFTADVVRTVTRRCADHVNPDGGQWCIHCGHALSDSGTYRDTIRKRYRFVSSFDYNEPAPLYFLAALPSSSRAKTVTDAIADLAPASVHAAMSAGLDVKRQGDIFFIPTTATDATLAARGIASRARLTQWTRQARARVGEIGYAPALTANERRAYSDARRKRYREIRANQLAITAYPKTPDGWRAEKRREIASAQAVVDNLTARMASDDPGVNPYSRETNERYLAQARARLDAAKLKRRERDKGYAASGIRHYGRCYNRAISAWQDATRYVEDKYVPRVNLADIRDALSVIGTAHTATNVVKLKSGATFVSGTVRHVPAIANERRASDHRPLMLDADTWYLAIRNTVPRNR